jgi:hypothetical protein
MPEGISETIAPAPVMTYGNTSSLKSKTKINGSLTTVELMANSGLKYVHATSRGKQGIEGDLEKSKKQVDLCYFYEILQILLMVLFLIWQYNS